LIGRAEGSRLDNAEPITLENVYAVGVVKLDADRHGRAIVGHDGQEGSHRVKGSQSYFDRDTTEKKNSGDKISIGLRTEEMTDPKNAAFSTWDRGIWQFEAGEYPKLY